MSEAFIPYSTQDIDDADIAAVVAAMKPRFVGRRASGLGQR